MILRLVVPHISQRTNGYNLTILTSWSGPKCGINVLGSVSPSVFTVGERVGGGWPALGWLLNVHMSITPIVGEGRG